MELFTIDTILPAASGILFITQAIYHLGLYNKLYIHNKETVYTTDVNTENPPLSVIIVAKDAADELQENLPFILEQDYPEFEVIVIYDRSADDCDATLKLLEDKYPIILLSPTVPAISAIKNWALQWASKPAVMNGWCLPNPIAVRKVING